MSHREPFPGFRGQGWRTRPGRASPPPSPRHCFVTRAVCGLRPDRLPLGVGYPPRTAGQVSRVGACADTRPQPRSLPNSSRNRPVISLPRLRTLCDRPTLLALLRAWDTGSNGGAPAKPAGRSITNAWVVPGRPEWVGARGRSPTHRSIPVVPRAPNEGKSHIMGGSDRSPAPTAGGEAAGPGRRPGRGHRWCMPVDVIPAGMASVTSRRLGPCVCGSIGRTRCRRSAVGVAGA